MGIERAVGAGNTGSAEAAQRAAAEAARRAAAEAARRAAAEAAQRAAAESARQAAGTAVRQQQSSFEPAGAKNTLKLDGASAPATSLLTENSKDCTVNCLDQAADWVNKSTPELQARSELVFLQDQRGGAEGQSGHVVVRQGERVLDPSTGKSYEDMQAYSRDNPQYREAGTLPGTAAAKVFATEAGSPERAQALADANVSPALQRMALADPPISGDVPNPATAEPRDVTIPGQAGPVSVEFSDTLERDVQREDGYVTVAIDAETSVSASGAVEFGSARVGGSVEGSASAGQRLSYEVKLKEEDFERLKRGEIPPPHPLNPATLPDGASIKLEQSQFAGYGLDVGLNYHAAELGLSGGVTQGNGLSVEVSRAGDKVQVTAGPTEFIENDGKVSIGAGPVSVSVGRTDTLTEYKLRTAEFDLSNPQGQQAFTAFAGSGRLPEQEGPGVANTLRIDKLTYESVGAQLGLDIGPLSFGTEGTTNTGEFLVTHNPDGTKAVTRDATYGGDHPDLRVEQTYGANGELIPGSEKFSLTFDTTDDVAREVLVRSFTGDEAQALAAKESDEPITLSLTADDVRELQRRASEQPFANLGLGGVLHDYDGKPLDPILALHTMAGSPAFNEFRLAESYWGLYLDSNRTSPLPGTVTLG